MGYMCCNTSRGCLSIFPVYYICSFLQAETICNQVNQAKHLARHSQRSAGKVGHLFCYWSGFILNCFKFRVLRSGLLLITLKL